MLARARSNIAEVTRRTGSSDITLASTDRVVIYKWVIAEADAAAVIYCRVPNLIEVAVMRKRLASAITVVNVHISVRALLVWARQRVKRIRRPCLHEL